MDSGGMLYEAGISVFHMKDFASTPSHGEFRGWPQPRCRALLDCLLDILAARAPELSLINVSFPAHDASFNSIQSV